jgi:Protein of unknown function (DUF1264)
MPLFHLNLEVALMDRRTWLGLVGSSAGMSLGGPVLAADDRAAAQTGGCSSPGGSSFRGALTADGHADASKDGHAALPPVDAIHLHFCGIHIAKSNPGFQIVAQHYCMSRSEEMHQCLLYDSTDKNAKLLGVEYIISDGLYRQLPDAERKYWHPHTYEVLAGGLIAPSMKPDDELAFMKALLTTWGKTWHTWPDPRTAIPLGEPLLMWAATGDGQLSEEVLAARDKEFNVSAAEIRERRGRAIGLQVPRVSLPRSREQVGRQWTDDGEDKPTPR